MCIDRLAIKTIELVIIKIQISLELMFYLLICMIVHDVNTALLIMTLLILKPDILAQMMRASLWGACMLPRSSSEKEIEVSIFGHFP